MIKSTAIAILVSGAFVLPTAAVEPAGLEFPNITFYLRSKTASTSYIAAQIREKARIQMTSPNRRQWQHNGPPTEYSALSCHNRLWSALDVLTTTLASPPGYADRKFFEFDMNNAF